MDRMTEELILVQWTIESDLDYRMSAVIRQKAFRSEVRANEFIDNLKMAYKLMELDWDCKIKQSTLNITD